jgi:hypothetical protein
MPATMTNNRAPRTAFSCFIDDVIFHLLVLSCVLVSCYDDHTAVKQMNRVNQYKNNALAIPRTRWRVASLPLASVTWVPLLGETTVLVCKLRLVDCSNLYLYVPSVVSTGRRKMSNCLYDPLLATVSGVIDREDIIHYILAIKLETQLATKQISLNVCRIRGIRDCYPACQNYRHRPR